METPSAFPRSSLLCRDGGDSEIARIFNHLGFTELLLRLRMLGRMIKRNVK